MKSLSQTKTFGQLVKEAREEKQWTLADIEKKTGLPPATVWKIENEERKPMFWVAIKLIRVLEIPLEQLKEVKE